MKLGLANLLSLSRFVIGVLLYFIAFQERRVLFVLVFLLAGLTDFFDGFVARKFGVSKFGSKLDGLADVFIMVSCVVWLWWLAPGVLGIIWPFVVLLIVLGVVVRAFQLIKYWEFGSYHLVSAKIAVVLGYFFVASAVLGGFVRVLWYGFVFFVMMNYVEEFIITAKNKKFGFNFKSAFWK